MKRRREIIVPDAVASSGELVLHACCAPCSTAIVEWLLQHEIRPVIFYYNPNIYPLEEYEKRKEESKRHATQNGLQWYDADWQHEEWLAAVQGHEHEPERGMRCSLCFAMRLRAAALFAQERGIKTFGTTLASSRWKNLEQVNRAGALAAAGTDVQFWAQNWRCNGLQERRNTLIREGDYYNQRYCGCEFSIIGTDRSRPSSAAPTRCGND